MSSKQILGPEWHLSPDGLNLVTSNGTVDDPDKCLKAALDQDLKVIGRASLHSLPNYATNVKLVLQIVKVGNVAAPKAKEQSQAAPRMLKLTLTDGDGYVQAVEMSPVTSLSAETTAPGTKCLVDGAKLIAGFLLVDNSNFKILGGRVEHLFDKWQLSRSVKKNHSAAIGATQAPSWVPFGSKVTSNLTEMVIKTVKNQKNDSEFELQRKEAITEAILGATKKTFGGRVRQNVQQQQHQVKTVKNPTRNVKNDEVEEKLQKPSEKLSLFAFLEDKLPQNGCDKNDSCQNYHKKDPRILKSASKPDSPSNHGGHDSKSNKQANNNGRKQQDENSSSNLTTSRYSNNQDGYHSRSSATLQHGNQNGHEKQNGYQSRNSATSRYGNQDGREKQNGYHSKSAATSRYNNQDSNEKQDGYHSRYYSNQDGHEKSLQPSHNQLTYDMSKLSLNGGEFAQRTLRKQLNLATVQPLNVGDQCMAKYWEDGRFYPASVAAVTSRTYAVRFQGYGNIEEVLRQDCFAAGPANQKARDNFHETSKEFRSKRGNSDN